MVTATSLRKASPGLVAVLGLALVIAGLWVGAQRPTGPGPGGSAVASPAPVAVVAGSPSGSPSALPTPPVDCAIADKTECAAVVTAALGDASRQLAGIRVQPYVPGCIKTRLCLPGFGGYDAKDLVIGTDESGALSGWKCRYEGSVAACLVAPDEDVEPLATMTLRVVGVTAQDILLRRSGTTWSWSATADPVDQLLMVGHWELDTTSEPCSGCHRVSPPFTGTPPPGWCSAEFDAAPGARIEIVIRIAPRSPCRVDVSRS